MLGAPLKYRVKPCTQLFQNLFPRETDLRQHMSFTAKALKAHLQKSSDRSWLSPQSHFGHESCFSYKTSLSKSSFEATMITMDAKANLFIHSFLHVYNHSLNIY